MDCHRNLLVLWWILGQNSCWLIPKPIESSILNDIMSILLQQFEPVNKFQQKNLVSLNFYLQLNREPSHCWPFNWTCFLSLSKQNTNCVSIFLSHFQLPNWLTNDAAIWEEGERNGMIINSFSVSLNHTFSFFYGISCLRYTKKNIWKKNTQKINA